MSGFEGQTVQLAMLPSMPLPKPLLRALEAYAKQNSRVLAEEVTLAIQEYLTHHNALPGEKAAPSD